MLNAPQTSQPIAFLFLKHLNINVPWGPKQLQQDLASKGAYGNQPENG